MRIIALMPVRNEAWILDRTLRTLSSFCDAIIVADQRSTDGTRDILRQHAPKIVMLDNPEDSHSTRVRWRLLEAARSYEGENFLILTDADEILSSDIQDPNVLDALTRTRPGTGVEAPWIQLWRSPSRWRRDKSIWSDRWLPFAFRDDRTVRYGPIEMPNDHNSRIPVCERLVRSGSPKVLHFQFVLFERMLAKQRFYRMQEALELGTGRAEATNLYYCVTRDERWIRLEPANPQWIAGWREVGVDLECFEESPVYWYDVEVLRSFAKKGTGFFASIDLWDVDWEEKRRLAKAQGYAGISDAPIVDPRSPEQRLYHAYLHRFFRTPFWRDPRDVLRMPVRWLRSGGKAVGLRRHHLQRWGLVGR
jgi:glycosyltransferase involved in cell wall biosynthesis